MQIPRFLHQLLIGAEAGYFVFCACNGLTGKRLFRVGLATIDY